MRHWGVIGKGIKGTLKSYTTWSPFQDFYENSQILVKSVPLDVSLLFSGFNLTGFNSWARVWGF